LFNLPIPPHSAFGIGVSTITWRREGGTGSVYENTLRTPTTKPTKLAEERGMVLNPAVFIFQPFYIILTEILPGLHFNNN
jgi:hypothetical protein